MKRVNWKVILLVVATMNVVGWFFIQSDFITNLLGIEGFYSAYTMAAVMEIYLSSVILLSSLLVSFLVSEKRLKHFFVALLCAVLVNFTAFEIEYILSQAENEKVTQQMYKDDPQSRPLYDSERPLSMIEPLGGYITSPVKVIVYAKSGVLTCGSVGCGQVKIEEFNSKDQKTFGEGNLMIQRHLSPDGRNVYTATIPFVSPEKITEAVIGVKESSNWAGSRVFIKPF